MNPSLDRDQMTDSECEQQESQYSVIQNVQIVFPQAFFIAAIAITGFLVFGGYLTTIYDGTVLSFTLSGVAAVISIMGVTRR